MNNQVKLMDENKLLESLKKELEFCVKEKFNERNTRFYLGRETVLTDIIRKIEAGEYIPDTPPVPTIKPGDKGYKCKACNESFSAYEWNLSTALYCGTSDVSPIETTSAGDAFFICPGCESENDRANLEVVE